MENDESPEIMDFLPIEMKEKRGGSHGIYQLRPFGSEAFQAKITCIGHKFQRRRLGPGVSKMAKSKLEMYKKLPIFCWLFGKTFKGSGWMVFSGLMTESRQLK